MSDFKKKVSMHIQTENNATIRQAYQLYIFQIRKIFTLLAESGLQINKNYRTPEQRATN